MPRKSSRQPKGVLADLDLDFADDIALSPDQIKEAHELLTNVETGCKKVGLGLNGPKTKFLAYNLEVEEPLRTNGTELEQKR